MEDTGIITVKPAITEQPAEVVQLVEMWMHGKSLHTQRAYWGDAERFLWFVGKPLPEVTLRDLQRFADSLADLAPNTQARTLSSVKSLLAFGNKLGVLPVNVGAALKLPKAKNTLAERILGESDVQRIIALEEHRRNRVLLRLLYAAGLRVSEATGLTWRDMQPRDDAGQVTVYGKGSQTRAVLLSVPTWLELVELRGNGGPDDPVFRSRKRSADGTHQLDESQVLRIIQAAARRAGVKAPVSPHWMRHAHASHALDRGAPIHLVQATLGHANVATTGRYLHARPTDSSARYLPV